MKTNSLALALVAFASLAEAAPSKYPWQKEAGPIAGRWKASCPGADGMIVAVTVTDRKATGRIEDPGAGVKYGYARGEEILRLDADDFGEWVGQLEWRSVAGVTRWDPIRLVAGAELLDATMTTSDCFKKMARLR